jgi:prevent-host-death family protein
MPISAARADFSNVVQRVAHDQERICLTRRGGDVACVVCFEDARLLDVRGWRLWTSAEAAYAE